MIRYREVWTLKAKPFYLGIYILGLDFRKIWGLCVVSLNTQVLLYICKGIRFGKVQDTSLYITCLLIIWGGKTCRRTTVMQNSPQSSCHTCISWKYCHWYSFLLSVWGSCQRWWKWKMSVCCFPLLWFPYCLHSPVSLPHYGTYAELHSLNT